MKALAHGSLALALLGLSPGSLLAGDFHHLKHHTGTTTITTMTVGTPVVYMQTAQPVYYTTATMTPVSVMTAPSLPPAAVPVAYTQVQPVTTMASPTATYYYYQAQPTAAMPTATSAMVAPSLLAPLSAGPQPTVSGQAAFPSTRTATANTTEAQRTGRLLQKLREFAANNNLDRNTLTTMLRNVGLLFLRSELSQFGLGGLVPSPTDNNLIEELVGQVVTEKHGSGPGMAGSPGSPAAGNQFTFQGPVTLSFPNVQTVQIQSPSTTNGNGPAANNPGFNPAGDAVPPAPTAPNPQNPR